MINISVNIECNLNCDYCFMKDIRNSKTYNNISQKNFKKAVNFIDDSTIGIFGGEPLLHPNFKDFMSYLKKQNKKIVLFTNGIKLLDKFTVLADKQVAILINLNSPEDIGDKKYKKTMNGIRYLKQIHPKFDEVGLGINIYKKEHNYDFLIDALNEFGFDNLRLSIAVPNTEQKRDQNPFEYFKSRKDTYLKLLKRLKENGITPIYDDNHVPLCIFNKEEMDFLKSLKENDTVKKKTNVYKAKSCIKGFPLNIMPNLEVMRCTVFPNQTVKLDNYNNMSEIANYFIENIDNKYKDLKSKPKCLSCQYNDNCTAGCLAYYKKEE